MNKPDYNGPNFCPNCGCNVYSVAIALMAGRPRAEKEEAKPAKREKRVKSQTKYSSEEIVRLLKQGREEGRKLNEICGELGISVQSSYYHQAKVEKMRMQDGTKRKSKSKPFPALKSKEEAAA